MAGELTVDAGAMGVLVAKSIVDNIGEEQRAELIQAAVLKVITPPERTEYGRRITDPSPLQEAFDRAVRATVDAAVREYVDHEEVKPLIDAAVQEAVRGVVADKEQWSGKVAKAVGDIVSGYVRGERD